MYKVKLITGVSEPAIARELENYLNEIGIEYNFDIKYSCQSDIQVNHLKHSILVIARRK